MRILKLVIAGVIVFALLAGIYFPIGYIGFEGREARSNLFIALDQGALFWGIMIAALSIKVI